MLTALDLLIKGTMALLGLILAVFVAYFIHGSLELYPTEEQQEKIRVVSAFFIGIIIVAEMLLFLAVRVISKKKKQASTLR
jgi:uncharacterized membrane protein required for colicin V production